MSTITTKDGTEAATINRDILAFITQSAARPAREAALV